MTQIRMTIRRWAKTTRPIELKNYLKKNDYVRNDSKLKYSLSIRIVGSISG